MTTPDSNVVERVAREDMVMFINACFACTGQKEFYGDARGQGVSIDFLHEYILGNYRRLYARSLAAGINHFNKGHVITNLLATGERTPEADREEEGALIFAALRALPTQRAYRILEGLRARKINNRRSRAIARRYLAERGDLAFEALKYRNKLRAVTTHAHVALPGELGTFLFRGWQQQRFETPLFEIFRQAHYAKKAVFELPYTIAEGFAAKHKIPRDEFLAGIEARMTMEEKLRLQKTAKREATTLDVDLGRAGLTRLAIYLLGIAVSEREKSRDVVEAAFQQASRRTLRRSPQRLGRVAAILDRSFSSSGSSEKRRRPLAVAWAASQLLRSASKEYRAFWTPRLDDELGVTAHGQSDLATPLLEALEWGADLILIVSDGYENDPPRGAAEVARIFRKRLDPDRKTSIVHLNPVFDAEHYAPRTISSAIPTVGLRDAEDLLTMLGFARFADGSAPLSELEDYLADRVNQMLRAPVEAGRNHDDEPTEGVC
ncbi:hypothetical protein AKJ09_05123 [Labilithrix luteola]|uniref:Uncharacterized protein n=1 Tax=Labilithrix luteola TaxID=1391654 RepID=A0A0K1PZ81_9BACT|nr:hypothetical protein [Labilithrix luteola]AKU98459.1 hypothetical protein AKJ09_05123 [Labilithrix luteola]